MHRSLPFLVACLLPTSVLAQHPAPADDEAATATAAAQAAAGAPAAASVSSGAALPAEIVPARVPGAEVVPVTDVVPEPPARGGEQELDAITGQLEPPAAALAPDHCPHHGDAHPAVGFRHTGFRIGFDGHLRVELTTIEPDRFFGVKNSAESKKQSSPYVGRNDGFVLGDARLNMRAAYEQLYVRLGFDGAVANHTSKDSPVGELSTGLKDAYLRYTFAPQLSVYVGRFKPPYDVEELTPSESQFFVHRSLESRGVLPHEGAFADLMGQPDAGGFAPGRQLGVMVGSDAALGAGPVQLGYALAVTNGNVGSATLNDNDLPAVWLRLSGALRPPTRPDDEEGPATYQLGNGGVMGLSFFYNEVTTGDATTRFNNRVIGIGFDIAARLSVVVLQGQVLAAGSQPLESSVEPTYALGAHGQAAVNIPGTGLWVAYRFAFLDPRLLDAEQRSLSEWSPTVDNDLIMHHTGGLNYRAESLPMVLHLEYTAAVEQGGRSMPNDRLEAAVQVTF